MGRMVIYIDYDNVYLTLDKYYQLSKQPELKIEIISKIKDLFKDDKILSLKAFADFEKINTLLSILQKQQVELRHVYSSNTRKNASDIALTISLVKSVYCNDNIDTYVIVSSDSDMLPLINELKYFDKDIFVIYSEYGSKEGYSEYLEQNKNTTIESILGLTPYCPIVDKDFKKESKIQKGINDYLNVINKGIINTFQMYIHRGGGTSSKKNIKEYLFQDQTLKLVENDASLIVEYLLHKNILIETATLADANYNKVLINMNYVTKNKIRFDRKPITEKDFEDLIQKKAVDNFV